MNVNKEINKLHKQLDRVLDEMIIADLDKIADIYFKKYQPVMEEIQSIVDECYSFTKMEEKQYSILVEKYAEIGFANNGDNRVDEINMIVDEINKQYRKTYVPVIKEYIIKPLTQMGIDAKRIAKECKRAEFRLTKQLDRLKKIQVDEIDREFVSVIFFARDALIDYGKAGRVMWDDEEEIEVEVIEYDKSDKYVKMTQVDEVIRFLEKNGYRKVRQAGTSHAIFKDTKTQHCIPVPIHGKEINVELAYGIQRQVYQAKNN